MEPDVEFLVDAIQECFDVRFGVDELNDGSSFDEVMTALRRRFSCQTATACFTAAAFWRLRRAAVVALGVERKSITLSTDVASMLGSWQASRRWRAWGESGGLRLPGLEYSSFVSSCIYFLGCLPFLALAINKASAGWVALGLFVGWPLSCTLLFHVLRRFANALPRNVPTMRQLARAVAGLNHGKLTSEFGPARERDLRDALCQVIADVTDLDPYAIAESNPTLLDLVLAHDGLRASV